MELVIIMIAKGLKLFEDPVSRQVLWRPETSRIVLLGALVCLSPPIGGHISFITIIQCRDAESGFRSR